MDFVVVDGGGESTNASKHNRKEINNYYHNMSDMTNNNYI